MEGAGIVLPQPSEAWSVNGSLQQEELVNVDEAAQCDS